jgi:hypothetical protein
MRAYVMGERVQDDMAVTHNHEPALLVVDDNESLVLVGHVTGSRT